MKIRPHIQQKQEQTVSQGRDVKIDQTIINTMHEISHQINMYNDGKTLDDEMTSTILALIKTVISLLK